MGAWADWLAQGTDGVQSWRDAADKGVLARYLIGNAVMPAAKAVYDDPTGVAKQLASGVVEQFSPEHRAEVVAAAQNGDGLPAFMDALNIGAVGAPVGMATAPKGAIGMFAGKNAKTANLDALAQAEKMAASGAPREDIWGATGWFKAPDGQWKWEIDDSASAAVPVTFDNQAMKMLTGNIPKTTDYLTHDKLYAAYPDLAEVKTRHFSGGMNGADASYDPVNGVILAEKDIDRQARTSMLHELQHAVQQRENFGTGGAGDLDFDAYRRLSGEVEARNVQRRMSFTPEQRRATPPWKTQDVPDEKQIVRFVDPELLAAALGKARSESRSSDALRYKAHDLSREMNWKLREGLPLPEDMQAVAASLDAGMGQHGYGTLWRGVASGPYARAQVGEVVTDPAYMSFSTSREQANTFGSGPWGEPALIALRKADKVPAYQFPDGDLERELVVGRNTPMRVVDRLEREGQRTIVWVEAVR